MYVYKATDGNSLFTVGFYSPMGVWHPESDHSSREDAAERVHWLNGGNDKDNSMTAQVENTNTNPS